MVLGVEEAKLRNRRAVRDYAQAFHEYGLDVEALPVEEAGNRLRGKPALAVRVAAALDDWFQALPELSPDGKWKLSPDGKRDGGLRKPASEPLGRRACHASRFGVAGAFVPGKM
jgi:hypothetical protein